VVLTRQPKVVLTALGESPRVENTLVKDVISCILGLSSATTMHVLTLDRLTPLCYNIRREMYYNKSLSYVNTTPSMMYTPGCRAKTEHLEVVTNSMHTPLPLQEIQMIDAYLYITAQFITPLCLIKR